MNRYNSKISPIRYIVHQFSCESSDRRTYYLPAMQSINMNKMKRTTIQIGKLLIFNPTTSYLNLILFLEASFLIRYLRTAKWSQLEALNRLESFLGLFNTMPEMLRDIDMTDPKVVAFLRTG